MAADGRIQAGDLILNVNDVEFSNLTNEEAVKVLRDVVQANGPITITVARPTYDGMEEMPNFEPRSEGFVDCSCGSLSLCVCVCAYFSFCYVFNNLFHSCVQYHST